MKSFFSFRGELPHQSIRLETLFLFSGCNDLPPAVVEAAIKADIDKERLAPDLIVLLVPTANAPAMTRTLNDQGLTERFSQLKRCKAVALCPYDSSGRIGSVSVVRSSEPISLGATSIQDLAREAGLRFLSSQDGVLTLAPPGSFFRNPSKGARSYFIRAGLMAKNSVEASFIAFNLLPFLEQAKTHYGCEPNLVWVDTSSIAHYAYALIDLAVQLGSLKERPEIRSFSSYSGYRELIPGAGDFPIVLISASTSGRLGRDIIRDAGPRMASKAICTLLGSFDASYPELLYRIDKKRLGSEVPATSTLREITVTGEDFIFSPGDPKVVNLKRTQLPDRFPEVFARIQGKSLVHYYKRVSAARDPKALLIDDKALVEDPEFTDWVTKRATGSIPIAARKLLYQEDDASRKMAQLVHKALTDAVGDKAPQLVSLKQLDELPPDEHANVAVIAAVCGSGMELMRVTRSLRRYQPKGGRYFLVGVIAARTYAQLAQLESNLTISNEPGKFSLDCWCRFAPSSQAIDQFRSRELAWLAQCSRGQFGDDARLTAFANERLESLSKDGIVHPGAPMTVPFLALQPSEAVFDVGEGFALWSSKTTKYRCPTDVLFTITCWLQHAREAAAIPSEDRLDTGGFQQAVIAPDCFLRFTDPVIQASILRAARDSELDYRGAPALSARAREIVTKFIALREPAVLEFLMSVAFGRMQLCLEDKERVLISAGEILSSDPRVQALIAATDALQV